MVNEYTVIMPSYQQVADGLRDYKLVLSPSEIHGQLCGYICAGTKMNGVAWLEADPLLHPPLLELYKTSYHLINDFANEFQLLLPSDATDIYGRAASLREWSQGFVTGLMLAGLRPNRDFSDEINDALVRIAQVAELDPLMLEVSDEDESALADLIDYIRLAVLMIYVNIAGFPSHTVAMMAMGNETVH
jgi:uncharacterized protein YgfB (UPF0149 family)